MNLSLVLLVLVATPTSPVLVPPEGVAILPATPVEALHDPELHEGSAVDLTGTVLDTGGRPLRSARVFLEGTGRSTYTDDTGSFTLPSVPAGRYALRVQNLGYGPAVLSVTAGDASSGAAVEPAGVPAIVLARTLSERMRGQNRFREDGRSPCLPDEVVP